MDNRVNPERTAATPEPERQGPRPVPYNYHDGREDYLHVGRQGETGAGADLPETTASPSEVTASPPGARSSPAETATMPPEAAGLPREAILPPDAAMPPEAVLPPEAATRSSGVTPSATEATTPPPEATALPPEATALPPEATPLPPEATAGAAARRPQEEPGMGEIVTRGLRTGAALTAATLCTMMAASTLERGSPWAAMNAMATAVGLGRRRVSDRFDPVATPAGIAALTGGMLLWGIGYEKALRATGRRSGALTGSMSAVAGFLVDDLILPDRLMKSFRRTMGVLGTVGKYVALGAASAASRR
ncbi:hypothetical protein WMF31_15200 [Sorangium sp. So ce1036]|uniref:hypothetical protein n=1 Tax=Sorangium sp. So ce1036 TaxID=3133328 RepID=UPI003F0529E7